MNRTDSARLSITSRSRNSSLNDPQQLQPNSQPSHAMTSRLRKSLASISSSPNCTKPGRGANSYHQRGATATNEQGPLDNSSRGGAMKKSFRDKFPDFFRKNRAKSTSAAMPGYSSSAAAHHRHHHYHHNEIPSIEVHAPRVEKACQCSCVIFTEDKVTQTILSGTPPRPKCINRKRGSFARQARHKKQSFNTNSDSEEQIDNNHESKNDSLTSETETLQGSTVATTYNSRISSTLPSIVVTDNEKSNSRSLRKASLSFWRRLSLEFSSDDSRRGSLSPNISRRNSATTAEAGVKECNSGRPRKGSGNNFEKWFPSLLQRVGNTASADWLPIFSSKSVPEVSSFNILSLSRFRNWNRFQQSNKVSYNMLSLNSRCFVYSKKDNFR